ncbi:LuxR C-terminal-related transcriptional regulator [Streptomyces sp. NPDC054854]
MDKEPVNPIRVAYAPINVSCSGHAASGRRGVAINLDETDIKLYRAEIGQLRYSEEELAQHVGISRQELRMRRKRLSDLHLLQHIDDQTYIALSPQAAADSLLAGDERELEQRRREITSRREELAALTPDYLDARHLRSTSDNVEILEGVETVRAMLTDLAALSRRSVDSMVTGGAQSERALDAALPLDRKLLERGIALRSLFVGPARSHPPTLRYLRAIQKLGAHVRISPLLPTRMLIYDGETAVIPLDPNHTSQGAVLIRSQTILSLLTHLFDLHWEQARPLGTAPAEGDELTGLERTVLRMMAAGNLDEVISKHIGVSVRTTRRIISDLTNRLEATSRFQAGVEAVHRGWIS